MGIIMLFLAAFIAMNAFGIYEIAKRRGLSQPWLALVPFGQQYLIGEILDSISAYRNKKTHFRFIILGIVAFGFVLASISETIAFANTIMLALFNVYNFIVKGIYFFIYRDYVPKHAISLIIVSIFLQCETVIMFCIRKQVPLSMCFTKEDEWRFDANKLQLQLLWSSYHSTKNNALVENPMMATQMQSWTEFLRANFRPI